MSDTVLVNDRIRTLRVERKLTHIDTLFYNNEAMTCSREIKSTNPDRHRPGSHCSFCGKHQAEVWRMIAGPGFVICSECVGMCENILKQMEAKA